MDPGCFVSESARLADSILVVEASLASALRSRDELRAEYEAVETAASLAAGDLAGQPIELDLVRQLQNGQQARRLERLECAERTCERMHETLVELVRAAVSKRLD